MDELSRLPGVGARSAQRMAFYIVNMPLERAEQLSDAILSARRGLRFCEKCQNITDTPVCRVCENDARDKTTIMVVEDPKSMGAYEKTGHYKGVYHVLHGALSPMTGVGPAELKIKELLTRLSPAEDTSEEVAEIILATSPNIDGEATAVYLSKLIKPLGVKVTRIAHGVPLGGDLEYIDEATLSKSLEGRREF